MMVTKKNQRLSKLLIEPMIRSINGIICVWWIPLAILAFSRIERIRSEDPNASVAFITAQVIYLIEKTALPSISILVGIGLPVLLVLTTLRLNHPAIVCAVAVSLSLLYFMFIGPQFDPNTASFYTCLVGIVAIVAAAGTRNDTTQLTP